MTLSAAATRVVGGGLRGDDCPDLHATVNGEAGDDKEQESISTPNRKTKR